MVFFVADIPVEKSTTLKYIIAPFSMLQITLSMHPIAAIDKFFLTSSAKPVPSAAYHAAH